MKRGRPKKEVEKTLTQAVEELPVTVEHSLARLENTVQMSFAAQMPRNEASILASALDELDLYPSLAEEIIYTKPVGKNEAGQMQYAEGLSIRAAESLANRWRNSAYGVEVVEDTENYTLLSGVFLDYETNTRHVFPLRVSKFYKTKQGQVVMYAPDRFDLVLSANKSKLLREVILRSLPAGLKTEYELKARALLEKKVSKGRIDTMLRKFKELGITEAELEAIRGKPVSKFEQNDFVELIGIYNALKDGEVTKEALLSKGAEKLDLKPMFQK